MPGDSTWSTDPTAWRWWQRPVAALVVAWARPVPWLLALLLVAVLAVLWVFAVSRFLRADAWGGQQQSRAE